MKALFLMTCAAVFAGCCSDRVGYMQVDDDDLIALRLTLEWKKVVEDRLDGLDGDLYKLSRILDDMQHKTATNTVAVTAGAGTEGN